MNELLDIHDLKRIFKLGRTAAYRLTHSEGFPTAVCPSPGCRRWQPEEVQEYIQNLPRTEPSSPATATPRPAAELQLIGTARPKRTRRAGGGK